MKKKKSGKGKSPRARAVKDLIVSDARQVKGGAQLVGIKGESSDHKHKGEIELES